MAWPGDELRMEGSQEQKVCVFINSIRAVNERKEEGFAGVLLCTLQYRS